jgi:transcriptional regulator GlxA family with amidase domain
MITQKPQIALLAIPEVAASTLYGMFDVFSSAGRDWAALVEGRDGASVLAPQVVARGGVRPLRIANGVQIVPDAGIDVVPEVICVPEMAVASTGCAAVTTPARSSRPRARAQFCWPRPACSTARKRPRTGLTATRWRNIPVCACTRIARWS